MLPAAHRLRRAQEFRTCTRHGRSAGRALIVMHLLETPGDDPARVGFVVSRSVGGAVVRATVKRRLRHLCAARLADLPDGSLLVVRARAAAAHADSAALSRDVSSALVRLLGHPASALGPSRTAPAVVTGS